MRRSLRLYRKQAPKLPLEIQLEILDLAVFSLSFDSLRQLWREVTRYCLVSPAWKTQGQAILFFGVNAFELKLSNKLAAHPHLGQLIAHINFADDAGESARILAQLDLLPNLKTVKRLFWSPGLRCAPPALEARPALRELSVIWAAGENDLDDPEVDGQPPPIAPWLNLETPEMTDLMVVFISEVTTDNLFADISTSLRHLHIRVVGAGHDCARVAAQTACFTRLESLTVYPLFPALVAEPNPLVVFRDLHTLDLRVPNILPLLGDGVTHNRLTTLSVGATNPFTMVSALGPTHPTRSTVSEICRIRTDEPTRFPALRSICLRALVEGFSAAGRRTMGVAAMARELRAVGLRLVDPNGTEWDPAWEAELAPADAGGDEA